MRMIINSAMKSVYYIETVRKRCNSRKKSHEPPMGKKYITIPMCHSWERITLFVPWVTHGMELHTFIACKTPKKY